MALGSRCSGCPFAARRCNGPSSGALEGGVEGWLSLFSPSQLAWKGRLSEHRRGPHPPWHCRMDRELGWRALVRARDSRAEPGAFAKVSALGVDEQRTHVVIDIDAPLEARPALGDAYRVDAHVVVETADDVMMVPATALFRERDGRAVFKVIDGIARKKIVMVTVRSQFNAVVNQGLDVGDRVILFPTAAIADGVRVRRR